MATWAASARSWNFTVLREPLVHSVQITGEGIKRRRWRHAQWSCIDVQKVLVCQSSLGHDLLGGGPHQKHMKPWRVKIPRQRVLLLSLLFALSLTCSETCPHLWAYLFSLYSLVSKVATWPIALWTPHAGCWAGLDFNMEQTLWAVAYILAPLKTRLNFFHGGRDREGTLEGDPLNFTSSIKLSMKPQENSFLHGTPEMLHPP